MVLKLILLNLLFLYAKTPHDKCKEWFLKSKIKQDKNCELNCSILDAGMDSYFCPNQCDLLCKIKFQDSEPPTNLYGLTEAEVKICKDNPVLCTKAYKLSWDADSTCREIYGKSLTNDESDACRHFMWAALMVESDGAENAKNILDAHENNPKEPLEQKAMDLANNRAGIVTAEQLIKNKSYSIPMLKKSF